jgi:hypothetical protein
VDKHGELGDHHAKVGECKIDDKHVGRTAKFLSFGEQAAKVGQWIYSKLNSAFNLGYFYYLITTPLPKSETTPKKM